jgi:hypothetical protein
VLTRLQTLAFAVEWERETGKCSRCFGAGRIAVRVHVTEGSTYGPCADCGSTGCSANGRRAAAEEVSP